MLLSLALLGACRRSDSDSGTPLDTEVLGPARSCEVTLSVVPPAGTTTVEVGGSFDDFHPQPMTDDDGDGTWHRGLGPLPAGTWAYKFVFDGVWETVPPDVYTAWEGGVENRALRVGDCELPSLEAVSGRLDAGSLDASFRFTRAADGAPLDPESVVATAGGEPATVAIEGDLIRVTADGVSLGKHSVRVSARDADGNAPEEGDAYVPLWSETEPFTWEKGLLYYLFLDRFQDGGPDGMPAITGFDEGAGYMGGDLVGARQRLEEGWFDDLGVTSIWLSPLNQNPDGSYVGTGGYHYTGYHGYWPTRAREVEDRLGTTTERPDAALRAFVDASHARGIRVVVDVVLNHVHEDHEYLDAHPEWFGAQPCVCTTDAGACNWDTNPIGCWFTVYLPDLDYQDPAVVDQVLADVLWWVEEYDVDGFRVDAAKHMDHVIMRSLAMQLRNRYEAPAAGQPGAQSFYLVGETFTGQGGQGLIMNYVAPWELDGQFDFPLLYPIRDGIGRGQGFRGLSNEMHASDAAYGEWVHGMSPFMGNHDVVRYATYIGGCDTAELFGGCPDVLAETGAITDPQWELINKLATSFAVVATQPGVPMLYYGDEIGLAGEADPDNRRLMDWDRSTAQDTLLGRFRELGALRRATPALQTGERRELWVDDSLFVYARDSGGGDVAIVALATAARSQAVPMPTGLDLEGRTLHNALAATRTWSVADGSMTVELNPWEYVVMVP